MSERERRRVRSILRSNDSIENQMAWQCKPRKVHRARDNADEKLGFPKQVTKELARTKKGSCACATFA